MPGRITRLAVEEGEVAVPGTFSRETGLLLTISDLSVSQTKVQVDETDVVRLHLGDSVEVTIDAFPDTTFIGRVTKVSNSAILTAASAVGGAQSDRAVDYEVEITLSNPPPEVRPDLSATAHLGGRIGHGYAQAGAGDSDHRADGTREHADHHRATFRW